MKRLNFNASGKHSKGFSLVELMIAMLLGLVLIGAATGVMLSNTQSFRATKSLSQIQDGARLGFELMARDIRQAGSIPCGNNINLSTSSSSKWYLNWSDARGQLIGHTSTSTLDGIDNQVEDTEALTVLYADNSGASLKAPNTINNDAHGLKTNDMVFICDTSHGSIFKATIDGEKVTASKNDNGTTPLDDFKRNAVISKLKSRTWYIGKNSQGSRSLYLAELNGTDIQNIEVVSGVTKLKLNYHVKDEAHFKTAQEVTDNQWPRVNLIQITLTLQDDTQSNNDKIIRSFSGVVASRNQPL